MTLRLVTFTIANPMRRFDFSGFRDPARQDRHKASDRCPVVMVLDV